MRRRPTHSKLSTWAATVGLLSIIVGACSAAASPSPSPSTAASVAASVALSGAPSGSPSAAPSVANKIQNMAVISPEKANDFGWNQQGVDGAKAAAAAIGAKIQVADGSGYNDPGPILRQLADGGAQFIIAQASGYNTAAPQFAVANKVPVVIYDDPTANKPGLVADIETNSQQGAYLAGVLAAKTTKTGTLGIVISADDTNWHKQAGGFVAGARSVNPSIKFLQAQIGQAGYADAAGGKRVTATLISGGADIIFGMGDGASFGMLQAVETATPPAGATKVWFIDVIGDKTTVDPKGVLLSSVLWNFTGIFEQAIADINAGTFGNHGYTLDVANGGISLLQTPNVSADAWAAVQAALAGIKSGSITVPLTPKQVDVDKLISGK
ncbi:MAG: BMP family ABC transporter substrate-binding protein [Chloroflexi bacterium]|nr:BMP family ABC transporter substrate-binding protein [Chloroflexota bacterium]